MSYALLGFLRGQAYVRVEYEEAHVDIFRTYNPATMEWSKGLKNPEDVLITLLVDEDWVGFEPPLEFETEKQLMTCIHESQHGLPAALCETVKREILEDFKAKDEEITESLFSQKFYRIMGEKLGKLNQYGVIGPHEITRWESESALSLDVKVRMPVQAKNIRVTMKLCRMNRSIEGV